MTNPDEIWAAGIYIREHEIVCIVGEVAMTDLPAGFTQIGPKRVPHTRRRGEVLISPTSCINRYPDVALAECAKKLQNAVIESKINLRAVHVACFGGFLSTNKSDKDRPGRSVYGVLTNVSSYNSEWNGLDIYNIVKYNLWIEDIKPQIDVGTDVDAAAIGEFLYEISSLSHTDSVRYIKETTLVCLSISRSINGGIIRHGDIWEGEKHPLMSIIRPPRFTINNGKKGRWVDLFDGVCPYHNDCIEGLIGVSAIESRTRLPFDEISENHEVWEVVAYYIAQLCICVVGLLTPSTIVLTGRTIKQIDASDFSEMLIKKIRWHFYDGISDVNGFFQPNYQELQNSGEFIRLPRRPERRRASYYKGGVPGRHGALRLAASEAMIKSGRQK